MLDAYVPRRRGLVNLYTVTYSVLSCAASVYLEESFKEDVVWWVLSFGAKSPAI